MNAQELDLENLPWSIADISSAVFDIDGTLSREDSSTSEETIAALRALSDAGIPITLATGRVLHGAANLLHRAEITGWVVSAGGTVVWDGHDVVVEHRMSVDEITRLTTLCDETGFVPFYFGPEKIYTDRDALERHGVLEVTENSSEGLSVTPLSELNTADITKASLAGTCEQIDRYFSAVHAEFPQAVRAHDFFIDIMPADITKWDGIQYALAARNLDPERTLGVGDSDNDIAWLTQIGHPIGAPGASAGVREIAHWVLPPMTDSVAALIMRLVQN
ncbi:HAD-IIB family hydrolase [Trueperella sp. LYQ141]|uniref:HAD-IIB family hydrolase n=1 Tax=Trueperella sp. LYQ141 TaxID=3391058 RepID=UPI003983484D